MATAGRSGGIFDAVGRLGKRSSAWFVRALVVAFLLHVPLFPNKIARLLDMLFASKRIGAYEGDAGAVIPIDLDLEDRDLVGNEAPAPGAAASGASENKSPVPRFGDGLDGGAPDGGKKPKPKPRLDAGPSPEPLEPEDAGAPDAGDAGVEEPKVAVATPSDAAGAAGKIRARDANVEVYLAGECLRGHPLATSFGNLLRAVPEWSSFFQDTPIDPITNLEHLLLTGPQLVDSSNVVAVMDFKMPESDMKTIVDGVVKKHGGSWLGGTPLPTAEAHVQKADRLFALVPGKHMLVILPANAKKELDGLTQRKGFSKQCRAGVLVSLKYPWKPFEKIFPLPRSIEWMKVAVVPTKDGGADVKVEARDGDPAVKQHAADIAKALNAARTTTIDLGFLTRTVEVMDEVKLEAKGDRILGGSHVSESQLRMIMAGVTKKLTEHLGAASSSGGEGKK